jgi:N-acyl-D-aspartate/D-glutamate deacylase
MRITPGDTFSTATRAACGDFATRLLAVLALLALPACAPDLDLILAGGTVIDGTGAEGFAADVGVKDGRIAEVGDLSARSADVRVDVSGHVVAPGFIDPHTHARGTIFEIPTADNFVLQGVTTVVEGNDGGSPLDLAHWFDSLTATGGTAPNIALFIGHGTIREEVLGEDDRAPTEAELSRMKELVDRGMAAGALGLSTGLFYLPGSFAETEEVIELARVAADHGGIYISHMRNEGDGVFESIRETIRIGREARIPVQMTHHKIGAWRNFGRASESVALMAEARAQGVDVTFDQYPYTASSTSLSSIIPRWAQEGGRLTERLSDPSTRRRIVSDIIDWVEMRFAGDPSKIQLVRCPFTEGGAAGPGGGSEGDAPVDEGAARRFPPEMAGLTLADVLDFRNVAPEPEAVAELIVEIDQAGGCGAIFHAFDEGDVQLLMQSEYGMIGSDGSLVHFGRASPHPRGYGTFPRVLGHYARDLDVISLSEAVRRMTSAPAERLGFSDRGRIEVGRVADLTVFDPETVIDRATFDDPHQYPVGIPHVFVAGVPIVRDGVVTGARPGVVLRGPGWENDDDQ